MIFCNELEIVGVKSYNMIQLLKFHKVIAYEKDDYMDMLELKRKLRQLKNMETRIRFGNIPASHHRDYLWNDFFSTKDETASSVKYPLKQLMQMDRNQLKEVYEEYFYYVYYQFYKENGILMEGMYDTALLSNLGLAPHASMEDIKKRFRELAKRYHPDIAGDSSKFIEILDSYKKLTKNE